MDETKTGFDKMECNFISSSQSNTNTYSDIHYPCGKEPKGPKEEQPAVGAECPNVNMFTSSTTTSSAMSMGFFNEQCRFYRPKRKEPPNIGYEVSIAKAIMQQYSTISGDNLFDHLSDVIKRVIDERPPNVIDFFEEFSRNVREQKFHLPERFPPDGVFEETRLYRIAKALLCSMRLPMEDPFAVCGLAEDYEEVPAVPDIQIDYDDPTRKYQVFNERVQQLQFYWAQCGFSVTNDDIFGLACAMDRLQTHPSIAQCRFWGIMNGLKASYYIVEAILTREEINSRVPLMENEIKEKQAPVYLTKSDRPLPSYIGPELTPGINGWENWPPEDLAQMTPAPDPIPIAETPTLFDIPPEMIGKGMNRFSYFVVNSFQDDWIELPIVTPKQIVVSRWIKKFLTGDLESPIVSYPCFPGKEKHYLRALIARITAGTYIAPRGYYRKMTSKEERIWEGLFNEEMEEEAEEEEDEIDQFIGEGEEEPYNNDIMLLRNEKYKRQDLKDLVTTMNWQHVRPNILHQGRIVWFDEIKAAKEREKEIQRLLRLRMLAEMGEEEGMEEEGEDEGDDEGEEEGMLDDLNPPEMGPRILAPCSDDMCDFTVPWIARLTSKYTNHKERMLVMASNVWPGAYTFVFEDVCESIYMGWGQKFVSRNMSFKHLTSVEEEFPHGANDFIETIDPTPAEEEAYRLAMLRRMERMRKDGAEEMSEMEGSGHDTGDDDDEEEEEEEE